MAAALLEKVAKLSEAHWTGAKGAHEQAAHLRRSAEELVEADARAYLAFVEAMRSAKGTSGDARERAIGPAREATVDVPHAIVRAAAKTVELAAELAVRGNPRLRSDAATAAHLGAAAAHAGAVTMAANIQPGSSDARLDEAQRLALAASARVLSLPA
jgi:formiminotetrahydrofolate cyclodeaminase